MDLIITNNNAATMYYLAYGATGPEPDAPNGNIARAYGSPFDDVCDLYSSLLKITTPNIPTLFEVIIPAF